MLGHAGQRCDRDRDERERRPRAGDHERADQVLKELSMLGGWVAQMIPVPISVIPIVITTMGPIFVTSHCDSPANAIEVTDADSHANPVCSAL